MRTGIYGGSFNPVHNGHIHLADSAAEELGLDRIFLLPSGISPHRSSLEYAPGDDRLEMLELACIGHEKLIPCDFELRNAGKSYTVYTAREFRRRFPGDELFLLVGSDMLMCFENWYRFEEILRLVKLVAVSREKGDRGRLLEKAEMLRKFGEIFICNAPPEEISSTEIRKKIKKNENISCYLPENVVQYIEQNNLYLQR